MSTLRLDLLLVQKKLANSRTHAQELIAAGQVFLVHPPKEGRQLLSKASQLFESGANISVASGPANRFVSRGGLKLDGALTHLQLEVAGWQAMDIGISTGGFTDCLLQRGVQEIIGIDVGHGQVSPLIAFDPRVQVLEGINARNLGLVPELAGRLFQLIVMDVSFISVSLVIPGLAARLAPEAYLLSLVKPQFEVGAEGLGKGGIVKDTSLYAQVETRVKEVCQNSGFRVKNYFESPIEGKEGNREFFIFAQRN